MTVQVINLSVWKKYPHTMTVLRHTLLLCRNVLINPITFNIWLINVQHMYLNFALSVDALNSLRGDVSIGKAVVTAASVVLKSEMNSLIRTFIPVCSIILHDGQKSLLRRLM